MSGTTRPTTTTTGAKRTNPTSRVTPTTSQTSRRSRQNSTSSTTSVSTTTAKSSVDKSKRSGAGMGDETRQQVTLTHSIFAFSCTNCLAFGFYSFRKFEYFYSEPIFSSYLIQWFCFYLEIEPSLTFFCMGFTAPLVSVLEAFLPQLFSTTHIIKLFWRFLPFPLTLHFTISTS